MLIFSLQEQWSRVLSLDKEMAAIERRLTDALRQTEHCKKLIKDTRRRATHCNSGARPRVPKSVIKRKVGLLPLKSSSKGHKPTWHLFSRSTSNSFSMAPPVKGGAA
jgi:hypothetical protein